MRNFNLPRCNFLNLRISPWEVLFLLLLYFFLSLSVLPLSDVFFFHGQRLFLGVFPCLPPSAASGRRGVQVGQCRAWAEAAAPWGLLPRAASDGARGQLRHTDAGRAGAGVARWSGARGSWRGALEQGARKLAALERARERRPQQAWRGPRAHAARACAGAARQGRGERGSSNKRRRSSCVGRRRAGRRRAAHGRVPAGRAQAATGSVCREVARGAGGAAVRRLRADPHGSSGAARGGRRSHRTRRSGRN
jgi:hypothetical protein